MAKKEIMKRYRAFTARTFYLTGGIKDIMTFGAYRYKRLAMIIAKIFAVIRDFATIGEWDGIQFGVIEEDITNDRLQNTK